VTTSGNRNADASVSRLQWGRVSLSAGAASSVVANLLALPLVFRSLGASGFGVWSAVLAAVALFGPLDLGLGNALTQAIAGNRVDDSTTNGQLVRSALLSASALGFVVVMAGQIVVATVGVDSLLGAAVPGSTTAVRIALVAAALSIPLGLVDRIHLGYEEAHRNGVISVAMSVVSLTAVGLAAMTDADLPAFVAAVVLAGPAVRAMAWIVLIIQRPQLFSPAGQRRAIATRGLWTSSVWFGLLQIIAVASYNADQLVISAVAGPNEVADYAVPARLFGFLVLAINVLVTPVWPMLARRWSTGPRTEDEAIIRGLFRSTVAISTLFGIGLVVLGPAVLSRWIGPDYDPDVSLLVAFALWAVVYAVAGPLSFVLIAAGLVKHQVLPAVLSLVVNVTASVVLVASHGAVGAVWASALAYLVVVVPSQLWILRRWDGAANQGASQRS